MRAAQTSFSIAIIGHHNPAIHNPSWYLARKLVTEEEARIGEDPSVFCTPEVSQFAIGATTRIVCDRSSWRISATIADVARATQIAKEVFKLLFDTPITKWGVNVDYVYGTEILGVFGEMDISSLLPGKISEVHTRGTTPLGGVHWARLSLGPTAGAQLNNFEYLPDRNNTLFSLDPLIEAAVKEALELADTTRARFDVRLS